MLITFITICNSEKLHRQAIPGGILVRRSAEVYPVAEQWMVIVVMRAPKPPPLGDWKDHAHRLLHDVTVQRSLPAVELRDLQLRLDRWQFTTPRLVELTILPAKESTSTTVTRPGRERRGLLDIIGKASNFLFGTATQEEVTAIQEGLSASIQQIRTIYH